MPSKHHTTFTASDGALIHVVSSLPLTPPDPSHIPTSPILTFSGPTGTSTSATAPVGTVDTTPPSASGPTGISSSKPESDDNWNAQAQAQAQKRKRSESKASVIAEEGPNYSRLILLLHGFSGSNEYFDRNWEGLAEKHWVVAWDMRGHGRSGLRRLKRGERLEGDDQEEVEEEMRPGEGEPKRDLQAERNAGPLAQGTEGQRQRKPPSTTTKPTTKANPKKKKEDKFETYTGGYHVARLAVDLHNLLSHLRSLRLKSTPTNPLPSSSSSSSSSLPPLPPLEIVPIGCSIGAAILWTYIELFTDSDFSGFIFVDQAPLQDRSPFGNWNEQKAHKGCYNEATTLLAQTAWNHPPNSAARHATHLALVTECLGYRFLPLPTDNLTVTPSQLLRDEQFFTRISAQCPSGEWLAKLIADHTRYDHREACEGITKPVLVMGGKRSGCFSLEGMEEVVKRVRKGGNERGEVSWFESGHWLFWEESERFNAEVLGFVRRCWSE